MDLRGYRPSPAQLERAVWLVGRGLLAYQPFIFSDEMETGAGLEFTGSEFQGMVYLAHPPAHYLAKKEIKRFLVDPAKRALFSESNQRLRVLYDSFIEEIERRLGPLGQYSFAELGCCSGYFPLSLARRGAKLAVGYDRVDYGPTFKLLNGILGTDARFVHRPYRVKSDHAPGRLKWLRVLRGELLRRALALRHPMLALRPRFDVVLSVAVLVHLSDPLQHLAYLGSMARKALLVWTTTSSDENGRSIHYLATNRYYLEDRFPHCFDVVQLSPGLLRHSLELMGFSEIHPIANRPDGMPEEWFRKHRGYLAVRPGTNA